MNKEGYLTIMNRNGELAILDAQGREREKYSLVYGAKVLVKDGDGVEKGKLMAEWDPYSTPIVTEATGIVSFEDIEEGVTMQEQGVSKRVSVKFEQVDGQGRIAENAAA